MKSLLLSRCPSLASFHFPKSLSKGEDQTHIVGRDVYHVQVELHEYPCIRMPASHCRWWCISLKSLAVIICSKMMSLILVSASWDVPRHPPRLHLLLRGSKMHIDLLCHNHGFRRRTHKAIGPSEAANNLPSLGPRTASNRLQTAGPLSPLDWIHQRNGVFEAMRQSPEKGSRSNNGYHQSGLKQPVHLDANFGLRFSQMKSL